jgi:hypothetical protein
MSPLRIISLESFLIATFLQPQTSCWIRVYDAVGNVIETREHAGEVERVVSDPVWDFDPTKKPPRCRRR